MATIPKATIVVVGGTAYDNKPGLLAWDCQTYEQPQLGTPYKIYGLTCTVAEDEQQVATMSYGILRGVTEQNSETWVVGDTLWAKDGGSLTKTRPDGPAPQVYVGVIFADEGTGGPFSVAVDVKVIPSLGELSGVAREAPVNLDVFIYNETTHCWEPRQIDHGSDLAGLADDDHTQYQLETDFIHPFLFMGGS